MNKSDSEMTDSDQLRYLADNITDSMTGTTIERVKKRLLRIADTIERKAPSDEEIPNDEQVFKWANEKSEGFHKALLARQCFIEGATWMRIKIKGK